MRPTHFFTTLFLLFLLGGSLDIHGENPVTTHIEGHWNYPDNSVHTIYVISEGEDVELLLNGISFGHGKREKDNLYRFENVIFQPGDLTAVSYDGNGKELSRHTLQTAGTPAQLKLTMLDKPEDLRADGEDIAIIQFEVTDFQGKRCGADQRPVCFEINGPAEWIVNPNDKKRDSMGEKTVNVENGINKVILKSTKTPGEIKLTAKAKGLAPVDMTLNSIAVE